MTKNADPATQVFTLTGADLEKMIRMAIKAGGDASAQTYAQAGFDAAVAYLATRPGRVTERKRLLRDEAGRIVAIETEEP